MALVHRGPHSGRQDRIGKTPYSQRLDEIHCPFPRKQLLFQRFVRYVQYCDHLQKKCSDLNFSNPEPFNENKLKHFLSNGI